ncbi:hypothetical protein RND59_05520 [Vibrio ruber]|uniref:hypothetical protein n=1 Tax=Vibrio ruber TaxID=184755 RepID=UPI0028934006|nr:hypothetical protein [Vibrio ruber]WNJ96555.1 hypothetical protein RND59_05520 [Vibrio ruber]
MGRNWEWSKQRGREKRLEAERLAFTNGIPAPSTPPFHSYDATMQSYFNHGWHSVTQCDIRLHLGIAKTPEGTDLIQKIRSLRQCLHHSQHSH